MMKQATLPSIKPAKAVWTCEACRKAPPRGGFARNWRWKTQRGFDNHKCYATEAARAFEAEAKRAADEAEFARLFAEYVVPHATRKVGETIAFVLYHVTQPTHEANRWGRVVHVRYDEGRYYRANHAPITAIVPGGYSRYLPALQKAIAEGAPYPYAYQVGSALVSERDIFPTLAEAEAAATHQQAAYDESVILAQACQ